jgi:hypothetical protein
MATNPYNDTPGPPGNKRRQQVDQDKLDSLFPPTSSVSEFIGDTFNSGIDTAKEFASEITSSFGLAKKSRSKSIPTSATQKSKGTATAQWRNTIENPDWRVKLSLPTQFTADKLLAPLAENSGLVFPYTPTIILGHSANYNSLQPVHTNYPFQLYENSSVQEIVITGDFTVENESDGRYWIAAIHYLRSVTKMFYGNGENSGQPPPRVLLNGYGDFVFNNVPCVVTNFTVDLPSDVDYIAVPMNVTAPLAGDGRSGNNGQGTAWVPSSSLITVTVMPTYSRSAVSKFNLNDFVNGSYITKGGGFI